MGVYTTYDEKRDALKDKLKECLSLAKELVVGEDIWGYEDMKEGYAMDIYVAIKKAIDEI
jgi:hypothetical protein